MTLSITLRVGGRQDLSHSDLHPDVVGFMNCRALESVVSATPDKAGATGMGGASVASKGTSKPATKGAMDDDSVVLAPLSEADTGLGESALGAGPTEGAARVAELEAMLAAAEADLTQASIDTACVDWRCIVTARMVWPRLWTVDGAAIPHSRLPFGAFWHCEVADSCALVVLSNWNVEMRLIHMPRRL